MNRTEKKEFVDSMKGVFESSNSVVIVHYRGMSVDSLTGLRKKARENGASIRITKNSLTRIAANDSKFAHISDLFSGPTAIAYSEDAVAAAKTVVEFAKDEENIAIVGGALDDKTLDETGIKSLASMPSLDESRAKLVGLLVASASKLVGTIDAPGGQLARVFGAYGSSEE